TNPLLEVYARMRVVYLSAAGHENALQQNLDELLKMARRDRYEEYRHIIYYAAAELELSRQHYASAQVLLIKSAAASGSDLEQKQKSFLLLGDMNYQIRHYSDAYRFYDSIQSLLLHDSDRVRVEARKPALKIISHDEETIHLQDSLQLIAAMPEATRDEYLKKLLKQLRKEKNEKDRNANPFSFGNAQYVKSNLPGAGQANSGGSSFYFQNPASKAQGYAEFISRWGNRPNVDNWQRQSAVMGTLTKPVSANPAGADSAKTGIKSGAMTAEAGSQAGKDPSLTDLLKNIPLTPEKMDSSNQAIIGSMLSSAHTFQNALEDYPAATEMYEALIRRFPASKDVEDALFNLVYCYRKQGMGSRSDSALTALKSLFPKGDFTERMIKGMETVSKSQEDPATTAYQHVYDLFLSGEFDKAKDAKAQADKLYGKNYWTPQLLFIESVYYVRQREDSTAINRLEEISKRFPQSPLAEKAGTMIDVLRRRKEIEQYLTNLKLDSTQEDFTRRVDLYNPNAVQLT
ncbi:MAG TPA: hypothetical protein VG842_02175, partial [Sediminibacterium sp.]|nr:hypothetical protein [Sediminibacterium sp.]